MNEFKFSCPNCQQNIQATPEYSGVQINCPNCQTPIIVPGEPSANAPAPRPAGKLTKAPSTVQHAATSPVMATTQVRRAKKPRIGLYIGLGVSAVVAVAAIIATPKILDKYQQHKDEVAAAEAAAKQAAIEAAKPPELTADEIVKKVDATYQGLTSFSAKGESVETMDMSQINPAMKEPMHLTVKLSILLAKPDLYRVEWVRPNGAKSLRGAVWSAGKGDYIHIGPTPIKMKNRELALSTAEGASGTLGVSLAELFFGGTNTLALNLKNYSKTNNETLNGRKCYVLTGQIALQNLLLWVHKDDFMIAQIELVLGGKIDDSALAGLTAAQKTQAQMMTKIKGNIIETYEEIEMNKALTAEAFQKPLAVNPSAKAKRPAAPKPPGAPDRANLQ